MKRRGMSALGAAALAGAVALLVACGVETAPAGVPTSTPAAAEATVAAGEPARPAGTAYGIAGLIAPNFPNSTADDYRTFFSALPRLGGWVGTYASWTPEAGVPDIARSQRQVGEQFGYQTLPIVGFHQDLHPGLRLLVDFADPAQVADFTADLVAFAAEVRPPFLGIGNEVNRIHEDEPAAFDAWVEALPAIVEAIHAASPDTRVFVTFQYEFMRGAGLLSGRQRDEQWHLLDRIAPHLDIVAFTTYPFFDYETPEALPADYYEVALERAGKPVAFSEVGWPSEPLTPAPTSALGGTPEEQAAFIARLGTLLAGVDPAFVMWAWAYDTSAVGPPFESLALHDVAGTPKPALEAWRALIAR